MTFPTGVEIRKCSDEELTTILDEAGQASKHARKLGRVRGFVAAHHLKHMREFLAFEELAIWRSEVNALKDAISMPRQKVSKLVNAIEQGKLSDEEYATLKRLVEKRDPEAAQVTAVTRDDTVQHYCSPCSPNPEPSPDACGNLENKGRMDPELEELKSLSAGTGLETPGQQCPPIEGIWKTGKITASDILTAGAGPSRRENISSPAERDKSTTTAADNSSKAATPPKRRHKTFSEQNKQFDPGGSGEKAPTWNAAVTLSFSGESWEAPCCFLFVIRALFSVCACFRKLLFFHR